MNRDDVRKLCNPFQYVYKGSCTISGDHLRKNKIKRKNRQKSFTFMFPMAEKRNCTGAHCSMLALSTGMCATKAAMTFRFAAERRFPMPGT